MNKFTNKIVGKKGEEEAVKLLSGKGYTILEKNWGSKWGEIDIIARDGETFVFVEVKTKIGEAYGKPEEMISRRKLAQVQRMASIYTPAKEKPARVDVVAVVLKSDLTIERIDHYEAVYLN